MYQASTVIMLHNPKSLLALGFLHSIYCWPQGLKCNDADLCHVISTDENDALIMNFQVLVYLFSESVLFEAGITRPVEAVHKAVSGVICLLFVSILTPGQLILETTCTCCKSWRSPNHGETK